jgi:hypothetical protein
MTTALTQDDVVPRRQRMWTALVHTETLASLIANGSLTDKARLS